MEKLLTYALKDNTLVHISDVQNGINCKCVCPKCKSSLIAKNAGKQKVAHFSHQSNNDCKGYYESTIHLLVKELILKYKKLNLPKLDENLLVAEYGFDVLKKMDKFFELVEFDSIQLEKRIEVDDTFIVPDIIAQKNGKEVLIEIVFSHEIDQEKMRKIQILGIPCLSVSVFHLDLDIEVIKNYLFIKGGLKNWIYNPKIESKTITFINEIKQREINKVREDQEIIKFKREQKLERLSYLKSNYQMFSMKFQYLNCKIIKEKVNDVFTYLNLSFDPILNDYLKNNNWNGKIYGYNSKYVYFNNKKLFVFDRFRDNSTNKLFYKVLKKIEEIHYNNKCSFCQYKKEIIDIDDVNSKLVACSFKGLNNNV